MPVSSDSSWRMPRKAIFDPSNWFENIVNGSREQGADGWMWSYRPSQRFYFTQCEYGSKISENILVCYQLHVYSVISAASFAAQMEHLSCGRLWWIFAQRVNITADICINNHRQRTTNSTSEHYWGHWRRIIAEKRCAYRAYSRFIVRCLDCIIWTRNREIECEETGGG